MKQALKIKLVDHSQFKLAWDALIKLGYHSEVEVYSAPYLFCYEDGHIGVEYMDVDGADLSHPDSASSYFANHKNTEITLEELLNLLKQNGHEPLFDYIQLIKHERPLFEANYTKNGGDLQFLTWDECDDGAGDYQPNWGEIGLIDHKTALDEHEFGENIMQHASHVRSCLMSWVECAKSKAIPDGWVLAPKEPNDKQKATAMLVISKGGNAIDAYKEMLGDLDSNAQ